MSVRAGCGMARAGLRGALVWLLLLLIHGVYAASAFAADTPTRILWQKVPIAVELAVGTERRLTFPGAVAVGVPAPLQSRVRVQSIADTVYLLAHEQFPATRVLVRERDAGRVYALDLSAAVDIADATSPIEIFDPAADTVAAAVAEGAPDPGHRRGYGYVTLTRFAAQQLYAPARLLEDLAGVVRVPVKSEPVPLVRGATIEAEPLIAWRAGNYYLTAVTLTNTSTKPHVLDPRTLRGQWLTATFQHHRLHAAGSEADRTVVYLISARPFAAAF